MSHATAATLFVEAGEVRFAHRRLGPSTGIPLVLLQRFRGTMDDWDPAVVDGLAAKRPVVLVDARGIGRSEGPARNSIAEMARDTMAFLEALALPRADVLGFSLGGMVAQQMLFDRPKLVRRALLVGTGGPGASGMFGPEVTFEATRIPPDDEAFLFLFFATSPASQAAGMRALKRILDRSEREPATTAPAIRAQLAAIRAWGEENGNTFGRLRAVEHEVLVVNGVHDVMIPSFNAFALSQQMPHAQLILYPDAGHGSLFQDPDGFVHDALRFLERDTSAP